MTPPPDGTPWWAWLAGVVLVAALTLLGAWLAQRPMRRNLDTVREQVENTHDTNLRDDIDKIAEGVRRLSETVGMMRADLERVHAELAEQRRDIGGVRADARLTREDLRALASRAEVISDAAARSTAALARRLDAARIPVVDTGVPGT